MNKLIVMFMIFIGSFLGFISSSYAVSVNTIPEDCNKISTSVIPDDCTKIA